MNKQITIHIDGPQGSGKTTLAKYLAGLLAHQHGITTTLVDDGGRQRLPEHFEELENHFNADVTIIVEQK